MRDRDKSNRVLRLVPAPHSDRLHGDPKPVIEQADDRERPGAEVDESEPDGAGKTALVVGAGTGWDAELIADRGFDTTAFDISPTAIETAHRNHPDSKAHYIVADLLAPPRK